jgi:hypothetical protein
MKVLIQLFLSRQGSFPPFLQVRFLLKYSGRSLYGTAIEIIEDDSARYRIFLFDKGRICSVSIGGRAEAWSREQG